MKAHNRSVQWLLDSDPAIKWQVMRDLLHSREGEFLEERGNVAKMGLGAALLSTQQSDGSWGGCAWNGGWNSTMHVLMLLREFGIDPKSDVVRQAIEKVATGVKWGHCGPRECASNRFFEGEIETCINAQVVTVGAYFGQDVSELIRRLLQEQLSDGGWNCDAAGGARHSSFNTTICVLEALLEFERFVGRDETVRDARVRGDEYLLQRNLFFRRSTRQPIMIDRKDGRSLESGEPVWTAFSFPVWWHYDILRALDYFRSTDSGPDERLADAASVLASKNSGNDRWLLDWRYPGVMPLDMGEDVGKPSKWNTLRACRVLNWYY
ncbi:MAG: hypothetical protein KDD65_12080 [Bacteroidetes bacterium]|nr:hypothetical protein [Bacteroidota bacterium]